MSEKSEIRALQDQCAYWHQRAAELESAKLTAESAAIALQRKIDNMTALRKVDAENLAQAQKERDKFEKLLEISQHRFDRRDAAGDESEEDARVAMRATAIAAHDYCLLKLSVSLKPMSEKSEEMLVEKWLAEARKRIEREEAAMAEELDKRLSHNEGVDDA